MVTNSSGRRPDELDCAMGEDQRGRVVSVEIGAVDVWGEGSSCTGGTMTKLTIEVPDEVAERVARSSQKRLG